MSASNFLFGAIIVAGLVAVGAHMRTADAPPPPSTVMPVSAAPNPVPAPSAALGGGSAAVSLTRDPDSHFYALAEVNGTSIRFLVDTGSSSVVLTQDDARRAGIGAGDFTARGVGAGGEVRLMPATVNRLALGTIAADNVPAMVAEEGRLPVSLLGQSFLSRIGSVTIQGDTLLLR
jgi:aspartyl protease family protein